MDKIKELLLFIGFIPIGNDETFFQYRTENGNILHMVSIIRLDLMYRIYFELNCYGVPRKQFSVHVNDYGIDEDLIEIRRNIPEFKHLYRKKIIAKLINE